MELNEVCSRCGKTVKVPADVELMKHKIEEEATVREVIEQFRQFADTLEDPLPEVITLVRKQRDDGEYHFEIQAHAKLCGPDDKKKRNKSGCLKRVQSLVDDIHRVPRAKKQE